MFWGVVVALSPKRGATASYIAAKSRPCGQRVGVSFPHSFYFFGDVANPGKAGQ